MDCGCLYHYVSHYIYFNIYAHLPLHLDQSLVHNVQHKHVLILWEELWAFPENFHIFALQIWRRKLIKSKVQVAIGIIAMGETCCLNPHKTHSLPHWFHYREINSDLCTAAGSIVFFPCLLSLSQRDRLGSKNEERSWIIVNLVVLWWYYLIFCHIIVWLVLSCSQCLLCGLWPIRFVTKTWRYWMQAVVGSSEFQKF